MRRPRGQVAAFISDSICSCHRDGKESRYYELFSRLSTGGGRLHVRQMADIASVVEATLGEYAWAATAAAGGRAHAG